MSAFRDCHCDWDPEFHRDLNKRRGKADQGSRCTNPVHRDGFGGDSGICVACLFGCPPEDEDWPPTTHPPTPHGEALRAGEVGK